MLRTLTALAGLALLCGPALAHGDAPYEKVIDITLTADLHDSTGVELIDINNDLALDIYVTNVGDNDLYINNGDATWTKVVGDPAVMGGGTSTDAAAADVDGDGDMDLFVANGATQANQLFINQGGAQAGTLGTFLALAGDPIVTDVATTWDAEWADTDDDGDADLFVANQGSLVMYQNQGGAQAGTLGTFVAVTAPFTVTGSLRSLAIADHDGDGDLDLFAGRRNEGNLLYVNQGGDQLGTLGDFALDRTNFVATGNANSVAAQWNDFDVDGDPDLFVTNLGTNNYLYVNQGNKQAGTMGDYTVIASTPYFVQTGGATRNIALGDGDCDGHPEIVILFQGAGVNNKLLDYTPGIGIEPNYELWIGDPDEEDGDSQDAAFFDADMDGDLDLYVVNGTATGTGENFYYENVTPGAFTRELGEDELIEAVGHATEAIGGDVDGDGDVDVYVTNGNGEPNSLFHNETISAGDSGDHIFEPVTAGPAVTDLGDSQGAALADLDGDGDLDLLVANASGEDERYYVNQGGAQAGVEGEFVEKTTDAMVGSAGDSSAVAVGDLDGDGDLDVIVTNDNAGADLVYLNQGGVQAGTEGDLVLDGANGLSVATGDSSGVALGDPDDDGDLDVVITSRTGNDALYFNQGGGVMVAAASEPVDDRGVSMGAIFFDYEADGDLDLYIYREGVSGDRSNYLYHNETGEVGATTLFEFVEAQPLDGHHRTYSIGIADFDNDTDVDVYTGAGGHQEVWCSNVFDPVDEGDDGEIGDNIYVSRPNGWFRLEEFETHGVVVADFDLDGDLDIVIANQDQENRYYKNTTVEEASPFTQHFEYTLDGTGGEHPHLAGIGTLVEATPVSFDLTDALPSATSFLITGLSTLEANFKGGVMYPAPDVLVTIPTNGSGAWTVTVASWPAGIPAETNLYMQVWVQDPNGPKGFSASNGLQGVTP